MEYFHDKVKDIRKIQRKKSQSVNPRTAYRERIDALDQLKALILDNEGAWLKALEEDLSKSPEEAYATEIALLLNEIDFMKKHLRKWMRPRRKRRLLLTGLEKTEVSRRPYGSILVIAPWNFPV